MYLFLAIFLISSAYAKDVEQWILFLQKNNHIAKTEKDIVVYHYAKMGDADYNKKRYKEDTVIREIVNINSYDNVISLEHPEAKNYYEMMSGAFHKKMNAIHMIKGGFYAAADPIQSVQYALEPGILIEVTVPKGTKYIDTRRKVSKYDITTSLTEKINYLFDYKPESFANLSIALKRLNISFLLYRWIVVTSSHCSEIHNSKNFAFNFISPEISNNLYFKTYTTNIGDNPSFHKLYYYRRYLKKFNSMLSKAFPNGRNDDFVTKMEESLPSYAKLKVLESEKKMFFNETFMCSEH
jgi:hypothetical protein